MNMEPIGLIAAIPLERDALLRCIKRWNRISLGSFHCICFEVSGHTCLLVTSGMGVRRASKATRNLCAAFTPRVLISFGIAGAVEADVRVGDVVAAEAYCRLEDGVPEVCSSLAIWPAAVREAAGQALSVRDARLLAGTAVTTNGSQVTMNQLENMLHPILEMETAGIAMVAAEKGIPLYSIRAISDGPQAPIPFNLGEMMDEDANLNVNRLLKTIVRQPRILSQGRRMMQNSRIAANNAAAALLAVLSQISC
jgi:adenosylhomocysteine nucleosidase